MTDVCPRRETFWSLATCLRKLARVSFSSARRSATSVQKKNDNLNRRNEIHPPPNRISNTVHSNQDQKNRNNNSQRMIKPTQPSLTFYNRTQKMNLKRGSHSLHITTGLPNPNNDRQPTLSWK